MSQNPPTPPPTPSGPSFEPVPDGTTPPAAPPAGWAAPPAAPQGYAAPAEQPWAPAPAQQSWPAVAAEQPWSAAPAEQPWAAAPAEQPWEAAPAPAGHPAAAATPAPPEPPSVERVGLGLAAATGVVLACCALTAVIYHFGFIASISAWLMAIGAAWAYTVVGGRPARGRVPLLVLIVVGLLLGFLSMVASVVWDYYWSEMGSAGTTGEAIGLVAENLLNFELWQELGTDAALYFVFAALGAFGVLRQMARPRADAAVN